MSRKWVHICLYTFIYLHIPPYTFIYLHIPSYTFMYSQQVNKNNVQDMAPQTSKQTTMFRICPPKKSNTNSGSGLQTSQQKQCSGCEPPNKSKDQRSGYGSQTSQTNNGHDTIQDTIHYNLDSFSGHSTPFMII